MRYCHGNLGEGWKSLSSTERWVAIKEGVSKHVLVRHCEIFGILTEVNHEQRQGRLKLTIGPTAKTGTYATLNIMAQTIGGIVGNKSQEEVAEATASSGSIEIPDPTYGYFGASQLGRESDGRNLQNDWAVRDLEGLIYVYRLGGNIIDRAFVCKVEDCACMYQMKYARGFGEKGEERGGPLAELQLGKVAARKEILEKQLE